MKRWRSALVLALGCFALVAQTLLFRDFLAVFEGSELGVGSFFASWLLWVGLGAVVGRLVSRGARWPTHHFEVTVLLYVPAFLVQHALIAQARVLGGVPPYALYPFGRMLLVGMIVNAPISLVSGLLFTLACDWWEREQALPPARIYGLEALGGFLGGVGVTVLLARHGTAECAICLAALVLVAAAGGAWLATRPTRQTAGFGSLHVVLLAVLVLVIAGGLPGWWARRDDLLRWSRLLPRDSYRTSFTTPQAKYLVGEQAGQFQVVSWGSVTETLFDREHAAEMTAMALAQHPTARRVLVVGGEAVNVWLCLQSLPQFQELVWLHPDPEYPPALLHVLPIELRRRLRGLSVPATDAREFLRGSGRRFDLILLTLPDPTTLCLNRYGTHEFFEIARAALADGGVVCTRVTGGANFLGAERVYLGSSALHTLRSVFARVVLKPGEESWLIGSDQAPLSTAPAELRDRFASVEGAAGIYPPDGLLSLYVPERMEFQLRAYEALATEVGPDRLINRDLHPQALFFSLLLALRRSTLVSLGSRVPMLWAAGVGIILAPILVYGLLRGMYRASLRGGRRAMPEAASVSAAAAFDGQVLVGTTGMAGMGLSVVLMFLYQGRFGSLFLDVGLISSLFMLGACGGCWLSEKMVRFRGARGLLLPACLVGNVAFVATALLVPAAVSRLAYAVLFLGCGMFGGAYFPLGAQRLQAVGMSPPHSGARLEIWDHWGGALGALLAGWLLLPLWGTQAALGVLGAMVAVNLVPLCVPQGRRTVPATADWFDRAVRPGAYWLAGSVLSALAISQLLAYSDTARQTQKLEETARTMAKGGTLQQRAATFEGDTLPFWSLADSADVERGYIFSTARLAREVSGFGGPVIMALRVDKEGTLRGLRVAQSQETPAYLESVQDWLGQLAGRNVFRAASLDGIDTVSGATVTSEAILRTLQRAGPRFATAALGRRDVLAETAESTPQPGCRADRPFVGLVVMLGVAIVLRHRPRARVRRGLLLLAVLLTGLVWNAQYSSQQVLGILSGNLPGTGLSGSFFLLWLVPVVVLLAGNLYCGYLCPFGALQELVGDLRPRRWATDPAHHVWRYGRVVKYVLLALVLVLFAATRDFSVAAADPLLTVFSPLRDRWVLASAVGIIAVSFFYRRFWCRNLCPAGAFLALLGGVQVLRRWLPVVLPGRCDLGVRAAGELDCLTCDRCRHAED